MKTRFLLIPCMLSILASTACTAAPQSMAMPMAKPAAAAAPASTVAAKAHVDAAWVRAAPPGAMMMAGYMAIHNDGKTPLRFVSAQSDAFGMIELHRTQIVNGVSTMRAAGEQAIPVGGVLRIEPGGLHLMLMQPKHALKIGDKVDFRLHFADGSATDVVAPVSAEAPAASTH